MRAALAAALIGGVGLDVPAHAQHTPPAERPAAHTAPVTSDAAADSANIEPFFTKRDGLVALGFVAGGAVLAPLDLTLANALRDSSLHVHRTLRNTAAGFRFLGFPGTAIIGTSLYALGRATGEPAVAEVGLHATQAVVLSYAFVWTGKQLVGRARPSQNPDDPFDLGFARGFRRGEEYVSFPSGHTAAAFAFAGVLSAETREHWPDVHAFVTPVVYTAATIVGVSRMYHNRHWASDVIIGAGIGTFSGLKLVSYHHRNPDNVLERLLLPQAVVPSESGRMMLVWRVPH